MDSTVRISQIDLPFGPALPLLVLMSILLPCAPAQSEEPQRWRQHDRTRPRPEIVTPGRPAPTAMAPSDAIVLFDGTDLRHWQDPEGGETRWKVEEGCMLPTPDSGPIVSRESFGDVQFHVEWKAPTPAQGEGQGRGNSGIYFMGKYEVQVLDSFENTTYADGQAAAIYGQYPPLVNASLPPGEWQTYDIIFRRPRFNATGTLQSPTTLTVFHNGVLVQEGSELWGSTNWLTFNPYENHPDSLPVALQDHGNPVRFRNIWVRRLPDQRRLAPPPKEASQGIVLTAKQLDALVGVYHLESDNDLVVRREGDHLLAEYFDRVFVLKPTAPQIFDAVSSDISLRFSDPPESVEFDVTGNVTKGKR